MTSQPKPAKKAAVVTPPTKGASGEVSQSGQGATNAKETSTVCLFWVMANWVVNAHFLLDATSERWI